MSQGVLEFTGVKYDAKSQMEKPHFRKKDGGEWALAPGSVDFRQFQPGKLFIVWDNWTVQSATTNIPAGGGSKGGFRPQPYHPETFVSNVIGSAIQAGLIKQPAELSQWAVEAWKLIKGMQGQPQNPTPSVPSQAAARVDERNPPDFEDDIPFN